MPSRFGNLVHLSSVDSTNRYCLDAARIGAAEGLVVLADFQDSGRGRRGRSWSAPSGGALLCSILLRPNLESDDFHLVPSALGLAALEAVRECAGVVARLKWPNDLLVGEAKLAGVLTEVVADAGTAPALVVGLGLNLSFPEGYSPAGLEPGAPAPATLESVGGARVRNTELLFALLGAFEPRYRALSSEEGRAATRRTYREALATLGRAVRVETASGAIRGLAVGLGDDGRLHVESGGETIELAAGDVVHLRETGTEEGSASRAGHH